MVVSGRILRSTAVAEPEPGVPPPNCTAADLAVASGTLGTTMGDYLFNHPDVNDFFTSLRGQPNSEIHDRVQTYMDAHPQTEAEINGIRRCDTGRCRPCVGADCIGHYNAARRDRRCSARCNAQRRINQRRRQGVGHQLSDGAADCESC
jgi:hemophore-related protein